VPHAVIWTLSLVPLSRERHESTLRHWCKTKLETEDTESWAQDSLLERCHWMTGSCSHGRWMHQLLTDLTPKNLCCSFGYNLQLAILKQTKNRSSLPFTCTERVLSSFFTYHSTPPPARQFFASLFLVPTCSTYWIPLLLLS
jgi:hypothetical protein